MTSFVKISIAMATHNGERFLREQLDSLAQQTLLPCELVVCDDGSTDRTLEIVEDFAKISPFPVRMYLNERNLGYGDNFLKAASLCEGDWIAFCDQDDVWKENKLEVVSKKMERHVLLAVHSADIVDADLVPQGSRLPDIKMDCIRGPFTGHPMVVFPGCCMTFQSNLLRLADWENRPTYINNNTTNKLTHDWWVYTVANALGSIGYISESLMLYRRHQWTVSGPIARGVVERVRGSQKVGSLQYAYYAQLASDIGRYFEMLMQQRRLTSCAAFAVAAEIYRKHASYLNDRSLLYQDTNTLKRFGRFLVNVRNGGYQLSRSGGLGSRALFKDILFTFHLWTS